MTAPCEGLPPVRGTYQFGAALKDLVWFRAGGTAEILFRPADADDLAIFLAARSSCTPVSVIGEIGAGKAGRVRILGPAGEDYNLKYPGWNHFRHG